MTDQQRISYLVALHRALNLTFVRYQKLVVFFSDDWESAWKASKKDLLAAGIDQKTTENFTALRSEISPDHEMERLQKYGARVLVFNQPDYPSLLAKIHHPPVLLFYRGEILPSDFPSISVVGSRGVSTYGKRVIEKIVGEIAHVGVTIVSGLALGADVAAHRAALENGSRTIAVLGNGIDEVYPEQNRAFAEKFLSEKKGALLSEYLPGAEVRPENFAVRNRIVAGLSKAVIVIEAGERSGSLITAQLALDEGREVFAVPGEIFSKNSEGTNQLLVAGQATPAISGQQVLRHLGFENIAIKKFAREKIQTTEIESEILKIFEKEDKWHIDDLIRGAALPGPVVSSNIAILEIKGFVKNIGNQVYVKNF